ncbi:hypothetical protein ABPG74_001950 [Tetrahymena malaccensis]
MSNNLVQNLNKNSLDNEDMQSQLSDDEVQEQQQNLLPICKNDPSNLDEYLIFRRDSVSNQNQFINPKKFLKSQYYSGNDGQYIDSGYGDDTLSSIQSIQKFGFLDPMTGAATQIVYNMLSIQDATDAILECGCGTEYILPYLVQMKKKQCKLFLTDISKVKLSVIKHKLKLLEINPLSTELYDYSFVPNMEEDWQEQDKLHTNCIKSDGQEHCDNIQEQVKSSGLYFNKGLNVFAERADATKLFYANSVFDIYFGGMLINEVKDPFSAIKEAYRVLKKGGRVGFTIWDSESNNSDFDEIMSKAIYKVTGARTEFKYIDQDEILSVKEYKLMMERAGFKNILIWSQFIPYNFFTKEDYENHLDKDKINDQNIQIKNEALIIFEEKLRRENSPFGMNILCIVAQKLD